VSKIKYNDMTLEQFMNWEIRLALKAKDPEEFMKANEFLKYGIRIADILRVKNKAYGNAVAVTGKAGVSIRMFDKFERIKNVSEDEANKKGDEPIVDTVHDEAGYSILWIMIDEKSPVFYNSDGSLKFEGDWRQTRWAMQLRSSLGLIVKDCDAMDNEYDEIILCQRCGQKSFDSYHRKCYNCDGGLQEANIGGTSLTNPISEDRETGNEN